MTHSGYHSHPWGPALSTVSFLSLGVVTSTNNYSSYTDTSTVQLIHIYK